MFSGMWMVFIKIHWRGFGYSHLANLLAESVTVPVTILMFYCSFFALTIHSLQLMGNNSDNAALLGSSGT
jgi:hypothetical protein